MPSLPWSSSPLLSLFPGFAPRCGGSPTLLRALYFQGLVNRATSPPAFRREPTTGVWGAQGRAPFPPPSLLSRGRCAVGGLGSHDPPRPALSARKEGTQEKRTFDWFLPAFLHSWVERSCPQAVTVVEQLQSRPPRCGHCRRAASVAGRGYGEGVPLGDRGVKTAGIPATPPQDLALTRRAWGESNPRPESAQRQRTSPTAQRPRVGRGGDGGPLP